MLCKIQVEGVLPSLKIQTIIAKNNSPPSLARMYVHTIILYFSIETCASYYRSDTHSFPIDSGRYLDFSR